VQKNVKQQIDYLIKLTDNIGIIEHCLDRPDYTEGYCVDDNARALQVSLRFRHQFPLLETVIPVYFNFLKSALKKDGFYNDLNSDLIWKKNFQIGGEHYGRALAALGEMIKFDSYFNVEATQLFNKIYLSFNKKTSIYTRVSAQVIMGLKYYRPEEIQLWADSLVDQYLKEKTQHLKWFEPLLSYDNSRLPMGLLTAYQITGNNQYLRIALESLDYLTEVTFNKKLNCFVFPGNQGWFTKSGSRNIFDQQPIEAGSTTEGLCLAFQITHNKKYQDLALKAFSWYSGKNILKANMVNPKTGGIHDGFNNREMNQNQGAESIISYLLAYKAIESTC